MSLNCREFSRARQFHLNKHNYESLVYMKLFSTDSAAFTSSFLESCSNEPWFRTTVNLLQRKGLDSKILEKLSIVLQRLSKVK